MHTSSCIYKDTNKRDEGVRNVTVLKAEEFNKNACKISSIASSTFI